MYILVYTGALLEYNTFIAHPSVFVSINLVIRIKFMKMMHDLLSISQAVSVYTIEHMCI